MRNIKSFSFKKQASLFFLLGMASLSSYAQLVPSFVNNAFATGDDCYTITNNAMSNSGAAWYDNPIDLNSDFDIVFNAYFGANSNGADGMAFVLKTTPDAVIGIIGGGLGYRDLPGQPSLAVEFDTYKNTTAGSGLVINDPNYNHIALHKNGNVSHVSPDNLVAPVQASPTSSNIKDGDEHQVKIQWRATEQTFTVIFDCSERFTYTADLINTVFEGNSTVYFGFTGSTGSLSNLQYICFQYLSFINQGIEDQSICAGETVTNVDGTYAGAVSYQWSPATGVSDPSIPNPVFSPDATTTYTLTVTDNCGQSFDEEFTITISNPDATVVAVNSPVCNGENAIFNFSGTPNAEVTYTLNNSVGQTVVLDASGAATVTFSATADQALELVSVALLEAPFCEVALTGNALVEVNTTDSSFSMTPGCLGATATVTGDTGGTFAFNPAPSDGAIIDTSTGMISNGTPGATYTVEYTTSGTCMSTTVVPITLYPGVAYNTPQALVLCDGNGNGFEEFNLNIAANQIGGSATDISVSFYENQAEAITGNLTDQLPFAYTNTIFGNQIIGVRIENETTGCFATAEVELIVVSPPSFPTLNALEVCDGDNDGIAEFDLTSATEQIENSNPGLLVSFYESGAEAENGAAGDQLPLTFINTIANNQVISVRIENATTGCFATTELVLIVNSPPFVPVLSALEACDEDNDGIADFDLAITAAQIENSAPGLLVSFYKSGAEAESGAAADQLPLTFTNTIANNQFVSVRIENATTGCFAVTEVELIVVSPPALPILDALEACDEDDNGIADFDLTIAAGQIENSNPGLSVTFYFSEADAENGAAADQLSAEYTNSVANSQVIWVRADNTATGCYTTAALQLVVNLAPLLSVPVNLEVCDTDNDGFMVFDLTAVGNQVISQSQQDLVLTYHYEDSNSFVQISNPAEFQNTIANGQSIWITAENASGCIASVSFDIIVNNCFIQRGISPNGDGRNDSFDLSGFGVSELTVFNRYGKKIYTRSNYTNEWYGQTDEGDELPTGTYFYCVSFFDANSMFGAQKTGWIYINR